MPPCCHVPGASAADRMTRERSVWCCPAQDCNLVMSDANDTPVFQSATTAAEENPDVTPPCRAVVAGAGGGFLAIIDSFSSGDQSDTVLYTRPLVGNGVMKAGQILPQARPRPRPLLRRVPRMRGSWSRLCSGLRSVPVKTAMQ